jgi:hypothetical protein
VTGREIPAGSREPPAGPRAWLPIAALFALGAGVRALRFWAPFATPWPWDDAATGLQAMLVLRGRFPVHFLSVETTGAATAYPLAAWFALAGESPGAHDVFAYLVGLLLLASGYLVARRLLSPRGALLTLAILAVPPLPLAARSLEGAFIYQGLLILGNLSIVGLDQLFFRGPPRQRLILVLGILAGLGWWITPLMVLFVVPFALLALRTGLVRRARAGLYLLGFVLGSLPVWIYEWQFFPSAFWKPATGLLDSLGQLPARALDLMTFGPFVLGVDSAAGSFSGRQAVIVALTILGGLAVVWAAVRGRRDAAWMIGLPGARPPNGLLILWPIAIAQVAVVLASPHLAGGGRYLLPLYAVVPCWMGGMLASVWRTRRSLGLGIVAVYLGIQLWLNWAASLGGTPAEGWRWRARLAPVAPVISALETEGRHGAYLMRLPSTAPWEVSYLTGLRVMLAEPFREAVSFLSMEVDAEEAPPFVLPAADGVLLDRLRGSLEALGLAVSERMAGEFAVVSARVAGNTGFRPLPPDGWTVTASIRSSAAPLLLDGDASTGWSTGAVQAPGQALTLDLGREDVVSRLDLLALDWQEVPAGFRVDASLDGSVWTTVRAVPSYWGPLFFSEHHAFLKVRRGRVQAAFPPTRLRWIRIVQTGTSDRAWAAREIFLYGPGPPWPPPPQAGALAAALRREGVRAAYANHWLSARIARESGQAIRVLESNHNLDHGRRFPAAREDAFRAEPGYAIVVGSDADGAAIRAALRAQGIAWRETMAGPYALLVVVQPGRPLSHLDRRGWTVQGSVGGDPAAAAPNGRRATRWSVSEPVPPDAVFTLDLGAPRRIGGIRVLPGTRSGGPTGYGVEGSRDGATWEPIRPLAWAGPLYWTGSELLRHGGEEWTVTFPRVEARYLRLRPAGPVAHDWIIRKIEGLE